MCLKKHKSSGEKQRLHPLFLELPLSSPHISGRSPLPPKHPSLTLPFISTWSLFWDQFQSRVHFHFFAVCLTCNKITVVRAFWSTTWLLHGQQKNPVFVRVTFLLGIIRSTLAFKRSKFGMYIIAPDDEGLMASDY